MNASAIALVKSFYIVIDIHYNMMKTIQIRLPEEVLRQINREVKRGKYANRSDAIREYIRVGQLLEKITGLRKIIKKEGIKKEDLLSSDKIRKEVYEDLSE